MVSTPYVNKAYLHSQNIHSCLLYSIGYVQNYIILSTLTRNILSHNLNTVNWPAVFFQHSQEAGPLCSFPLLLWDIKLTATRLRATDILYSFTSEGFFLLLTFVLIYLGVTLSHPQSFLEFWKYHKSDDSV